MKNAYATFLIDKVINKYLEHKVYSIQNYYFKLSLNYFKLLP